MLDTPPPDLATAARRVLEGLNERILDAGRMGRPLPVYDGIADLHTALAAHDAAPPDAGHAALASEIARMRNGLRLLIERAEYAAMRAHLLAAGDLAGEGAARAIEEIGRGLRTLLEASS